MNAVGRPRVVVVEDDASVRRFVTMALEGLPIELVECTSVAEALRALASGRARLLLTDLGLPDESGLVLLERLQREPALRGDARVAVFSAAVDAQVRAQLDRLGVWRVLPKPVSLAALEACVMDALDQASPPPAPVAEAPQGLPHDQAEAVAHQFQGNARLYADFRGSCLAQFPHDVEAADKACAAGDVQALRRVAHSLKTVLYLLGHPALAAQAEQAEHAAASGALAPAEAQWQALRAGLLLLVASR